MSPGNSLGDVVAWLDRVLTMKGIKAFNRVSTIGIH